MSANCIYCGAAEVVELQEVYGDGAIMYETCCEEAQAHIEAYGLDRDKWKQIIADGSGQQIKDVHGRQLNFYLQVHFIPFKTARDFVAAHHRHNLPPRGHKYSLGCYNGTKLVAVAVTGRPVSRVLDQQGGILEVTRLCVDPDQPPDFVANASSMLYAAAAKLAKRQGYTKIITYTLVTELGTSVKAAGFEIEYTQRKRNDGWTRGSKRLPTDGIQKHRWAKMLIKPPNC